MPAIESELLSGILRSQMDTNAMRALLHTQLQNLPPNAREACSAAAVKKVNETLAKEEIPSLPPLPAADEAKMQKHLSELRETGISLLGPVLNKAQVADIHRSLATQKVYGSHVWTFSDHIGKPREEVRKTHKQACYVLEDTLQAPHLLETMSNPLLLKTVEQYLGCVPTLFQSNLMWSFQKKDSKPGVAQAFHRDWDNFRFCVLFIYLTDVDTNTGPHQFLRKSHRLGGVEEAVARYRKENPSEINVDASSLFRDGSTKDTKLLEIFDKELLQIEQPAGYAFLVDAFGLHRGVPLIQGERLLFWARYGLYDNGFSVDVTPGPLDPAAFAGRLKDDKTHRYIYRAVLKSEYTEAPTTSLHTKSIKDFEALCEEIARRFGRRRFIIKAAELALNRIPGVKNYFARRRAKALQNPERKAY